MRFMSAGENVRDNLLRIRQAHRLTYAEVSRTLEDLGRPIAPLGLSRIENGERRVDVDDLMALAEALGVEPDELLSGDGPPSLSPSGQADVTTVRYRDFSPRLQDPAPKQIEGEVLLDDPTYLRVETADATYLIPHVNVISIRTHHEPEESEQ